MLSEPAGLPARPDYVAGSFRDRAGRVFEHDGEIFRAISEQAREEWEFAASLEFVRNGMQRHEIVPTKYSRQHAAAAAISDEWTAVLHHERLPLVTYPYEWSFSMLRDAVLHHLVIGCNLLLPDVIDWLAERRAALVIEFVDRRDPQVQSLLANRDDVFPDYSREAFERCLRRRFTVRRTVDLPSGARTLFHVTPSA